MENSLVILGFFVTILIMGVVFWAAQKLIAAFQIPEPISTVILVLLVIVCLLWILNSYIPQFRTLF